MEAQARIFLTGGTGFFGRALLRHWQQQAAQGHAVPSVVVGTRAPKVFLRQYPEFGQCPWLQLHQSDILHSESLPESARFSHVLHAATDSTLGPSLTPLQRYDQIVTGTRNVLDFAVRNGVPRLLLTSSGGVYGPQAATANALEETCQNSPDPMQPANAYGMGKRAAEHLCALYAHEFGLQTVVARCFAFVGPDLPLDVHFAIGNFIRDALWADCIRVQGDGSPLRSYMDQSDLARWLLTLLESGESGQAYNVGSPEAISIAELAYLVRDTLAPHKPVEVLGQRQDTGPRNRYLPDVSKAQRTLGLHITIPLREAILRTAAAHVAGTPSP